MEFRNLEHCDFNTLFNGFERAFADYEIHFEKEEIRSMLKRRGFNPKLSFAYFEDGEIVAFTLNGTGIFNNLPTAYDTGTGTVKEFRGKGLAGEIFTRSIPFLKESGIKQYLLEVLKNNQKAINIYSKQGFNVTREFDCFRQSLNNVTPLINNEKANFIINPISFEAVLHGQNYCDFNPSWQNSIDSIKRGKSELINFGALVDGDIVGFCVLDSSTGDLTQIAVKRDFRGRGIGSRLLHEALSHMKTNFIKVLNVSSTDQSLHSFLENRNIVLASKQLEMNLIF